MNIHLTEVFLGIFIGAVTFTGSIVAFGKLRGKISSKPLMLPHRHKLNLAALVVSFLLLVAFVRTDSTGTQVLALLVMTVIARLWLASGGFDRRGRYAGRGLNAELLLGLGSGSGGLYAQQRPADCDRGAGGLVGCDSVLHHV